MNPPRLSVITVWYKSTDSVEKTSNSWHVAFNESDEPLELCVAENSEYQVTDFDSFSKPFGNHVTLALSDNESNLGFARAANLLAQQSQGEWLLFLNPDVFLPTGAINSLLDAIDELVQESRKVSAISLEVSGTVFSGITFNSIGLFIDRRNRSKSKILGPSGGALLIERETFLNLGGFKEALFMWGEDVDFGLTLRANGIDTAEIDFRWKHIGSHSVKDSDNISQKAYLIARNRLWILRSRFDKGYLIRFFPIVVIIMLGNLIIRKLPSGLFYPYLRGIRHGLFAPLPEEISSLPKISSKHLR